MRFDARLGLVPALRFVSEDNRAALLLLDAFAAEARFAGRLVDRDAVGDALGVRGERFDGFFGAGLVAI